MRRFLVPLLAAVLVTSAAHALELSVRLDAREIARKRVHTRLGLDVRPGPLTLAFPKWIPGEHGPTGPLETLIGLEIRGNGTVLAWSRDPLDMYALRLVVPPGVTRLEVTLESGLAIDTTGFSAGPTSTDALAVVPWNEFLLVPKGVDAATLVTHATLVPPPGWSVVSPLRTHAAADGSVALEDTNAAQLIDSPVQIGRFAKRVELQGSAPGQELKHTLSIMADGDAALALPDDFAAGYARLVAEAGALFGSRPYRSYTWIVSLSDHVAHFGLEHHESSDDRDYEATLSEPDRRMGLASLLGHEYVHAWNGKFRRPQGLLSPDYQKPMDGSLLWVYEGLTEFWGDVLATRAGLETPERFREYIADVTAEFTLGTGARWRPMGDTAVAAQVLYGAPSAWQASRRSVDYYDASVFLWLDVEQELRARSGGKRGLDDFCKQFYAAPTGVPQLKPYGEDEVLATLAAVAPNDWRAFIHRHLDVPGTAALEAALARAGWRLAYSPEKSNYIETRQKVTKNVERQWSIGFKLDKDGKLIDVIDDSAAAHAGAAPGTKLIGVNGRKFTTEILDAAIADAQTSHRPIELLLESDEFFRTLSVAYDGGPRYPHLVAIDGRPDGLAAIIAPRRP